jgi:hypothetical protein
LLLVFGISKFWHNFSFCVSHFLFSLRIAAIPGFQVYVIELPALMAYGRHRRSAVIDSLEAGILYSIRVQRVSRDGSVLDVPNASTSSNRYFLMLVHIESQANAAGDSENVPPAALFAQQIDSAKRRFESQIEDAQKVVRSI